jgi:hypothetical protein
MQHLQPNSTLQSGKYRIERVLGQGGFGRVLIVLLLMIAPVMVMAQASGGQIRRTTNQIVQKQSKKQKGKMQNDNKSVADKYDAMDVRVRLGSYRIVGLDKIVKAKEGDNLVKISRRILGPDMECYLEVYNGIRASDTLTVGQEIHIPKLELKKRK